MLKNLAARIKQLRAEARELQADTAAAIGVSRAHLSKLETGDDTPSREVSAAIARHFRVSLDWLITGQGPRTTATTDREARLLEAFRRIPQAEAEAILNMLEARFKSGE